jgi:hypothetical protein
MSKKGKSPATSITAEQRREIIGITSQVAIEKYQKAMENHRKEARDRRLHNTKLLLERYRSFVVHSESAVYDATQVEDDMDLESLLDLMDCKHEQVSVESVRDSVARTRLLLNHVDLMLGYFKYHCEHSPRVEDARRYRVIHLSYLVPEEEQKTFQEIADEEGVDISTIYKDQKAAIRQLSALLFGVVE